MNGYSQRRTRNLRVKKTFLVSPETDEAIVELTKKYGNEAQVIRVALDTFFLAEGVSISNELREQDTTDAELAAA